MFSIKLNGKEVTSFDDLSPLELYPSLFYTELTINDEKFGVYIKKEDEDRLMKCLTRKEI